MKRSTLIWLMFAVCLLISFIGEREEQSAQTDNEVYSYSFAQKSTFNAAAFYQQNYPMVWGYIYKNASAPYEYIAYYHKVWGDLQRYTGDGINFDTLTSYERSLVNYPAIGRYIYFANSKSRKYHSTYKCYSLLKSTPISRDSSYAYMYDPCSKCVGR